MGVGLHLYYMDRIVFLWAGSGWRHNTVFSRFGVFFVPLSVHVSPAVLTQILALIWEFGIAVSKARC
jgi:hypothetical protein